MRKEVVFSSKFDTSEFDRSVEMMKSKLEKIMMPSATASSQMAQAQRMQQMGIGGMSAPSMEAYQKATQSARRELDQMISEQAKGQDRLAKIMTQRVETIKKLQTQQKDLLKDSEAELKIKEKIARLESNNQQAREIYKQRDAALNQALDARESIQQNQQQGIRDRNPAGFGRAGRFVGQGMYGAAGREAFNAAGGWSGIGTILGAAGTAINIGDKVYNQVARSPFQTAINTGGAMEGTIGRTIGDMGSVYGQSWNRERLRALSGAGRMDEISRRSDVNRLAAGSAMAAGGLIGGAAASGTIVGLPAGLISAVTGLLAGGATAFGSERTRALAGSGIATGIGESLNQTSLGRMTGAGNWMKGIGDQQMKQYNSILAKEFAENFQTALNAEQQMNPLKKLAAQTYDQNMTGYLTAQRGMGLDYYGFHGPGGFREQQINAGFTDQMGMEMAGGILGAGGSTRMARDSSTTLQFQRGLGLTNSAQVMGTLSGGLGSAESTKQATIKILAEGMKLGLDDSKFAEENRKFVQMTAEIVARSGATTEADFQRVSGGFGKFVGENTGLGLQAAKGAYEEYQGMTQETTGPRGVMRAAGIMADKDLNKMSTMTKQALMSIKEEELSPEHPLVQQAAKESNLSPEEVIGKMKGVNQGATSRFAQTDIARDKLKGYMQSIGKTRLSAEDIKSMPEEMRNTFNEMATMQTVERGAADPRTIMDRALGTINMEGAPEKTQLGRENIIADKLTRETGRVEDESVKALAESSRLALDSFQSFHKELVPTVESIKEFNKAVKDSVQQMRNMSPENRGSFNEAVSKMLGVSSSSNQPQAGSTNK